MSDRNHTLRHATRDLLGARGSRASEEGALVIATAMQPGRRDPLGARASRAPAAPTCPLPVA